MDAFARRYVRNEGIVCREVAGETILVPVCSDVADLSSVYILNAVGAAVWSNLAESNSGRDLARGIAEEFDTTIEIAERDVAAYLADLAEAGLVVPAKESG